MLLRGQHCRIGFIYPANSYIDDELWKMIPTDAAVYVTRIAGGGTGPFNLHLATKLSETIEIEQAARAVAMSRPNVIAYGCTSGSFVRGVRYDKSIAECISKATGIPAVTTSSAIVQALNELGVRSVSVAAPYVDEICGRLRIYLEDAGFRVRNIAGLGLTDDWDFGFTPAEVFAQLAEQVNTPESDAIVIPCTGIRTAEIIEDLEKKLRKPVVTANQATMWASLKMAQCTGAVYDRGRLLRDFL